MDFFKKLKAVVNKIFEPSLGSPILYKYNFLKAIDLNVYKKNIKKSEKSSSNINLTELEISNNLKINKKMAMFNYGVGGNEVTVDANEAIQEIQGNKTLLVGKLTSEESVNPEIVSGLKTVEDVFNHYSPQVSVAHSTEDGQEVKEDFKFTNLGDFTPKKLIENSEFLKNLKLEEEQYNKIVKQLRVNKVLRKLFEDENAKQEFAETLRAIVKELEKK